jgi:glyoxylase-like metal-dependent hydrolase (beta-lactamase superfamily II)
VRDAGKRPSAVFITHGHGDHFFGAGALLDAFPEAPLLASDQQVVDDARADASPEHLAFWNSWFAGQFPQSPVVPALTDSHEYDLEGHPILLRTIGHADAGILNTIVDVPDLQAVCAGDIAYNNIHMWLRNSTPESRQTWLASLDAVAALQPTTIIAGHRDPGAPDDDATRILDQSRRYIENFDQAVANARTAAEVYDVMLTKYPDYGNRYTLFLAAASQFPS